MHQTTSLMYVYEPFVCGDNQFQHNWIHNRYIYIHINRYIYDIYIYVSFICVCMAYYIKHTCQYVYGWLRIYIPSKSTTIGKNRGSLWMMINPQLKKWWFVNQPSHGGQGLPGYYMICEYPIRIPHVSSIPGFLADGSELELIHPGLTNVMGGRWLMLTLSLNIQTPAVWRCLDPPNKPIKHKTWGGMTGCLGILTLRGS